MEENKVCKLNPVLKSNLNTYERAEKEDIYEVVLVSSDDKMTSVCVNTTDCGIAVVEAYLFLKQENPKLAYRAKSAQYTPLNSTSFYDPELIDNASNHLLSNYLCEANKTLVACYISLCNDDIYETSTEAIEHTLLQTEISHNTVNGRPYHYAYKEGYGAQLTIENIETRCSYIWKSYVFCERINLDFMSLNDFRKLSENIQNPEELLFWTFMMCFYGQCDCNYPYTLFIKIKENTFAPYLSGNQYQSLINAIIS